MKPLSRRNILAGLAASASTLAVRVKGENNEPQPARTSNTQRKLKIVVTGGHPGDPEYGCGGTIARCTKFGHDVVLLYLNRGDPTVKRDEDASTVRVKEANKACEILKARPLYAGQIDGNAIIDRIHHQRFRAVLEAESPNIVFTHWPIDNHADHRAISMLVYDAWLELRRSFALYYYEVSNGEDTVQFTPGHYVDISETEAQKRLACFAHASQSPERFYMLQEAVARFRGIESGHKQAEGFIRHVQSPDFTLPL
jgi:LmbE family N-acetylglucosaminyl deacetylase